MTDNEIIKALECHSNDYSFCMECPFSQRGECSCELARNALDLINRQKAEIESKNDLIHRQSDVISEQKEKLERIYAEAIKEFAERLKADIVETGDEHGIGNKYPVLTYNYIDNLVKEMVGED